MNLFVGHNFKNIGYYSTPSCDLESCIKYGNLEMLKYVTMFLMLRSSFIIFGLLLLLLKNDCFMDLLGLFYD